VFQYHPQNGRQLCAEEANFKDLEDGLDDIAHAISSGFSALFTETEEEKRQREYARAEHERSMEIRRAQREEQQRQAAAAYHAQQQAAAARAQTLHTAMRMARTEAPTILVEGLKIGDFCAEAMGVYDLVWTADHQLDVDAVNNKPQWKARNGNSNAGLNMYWAPEPVAGAGQPSGYWWIGGTTNPGGGYLKFLRIASEAALPTLARTATVQWQVASTSGQWAPTPSVATKAIIAAPPSPEQLRDQSIYNSSSDGTSSAPSAPATTAAPPVAVAVAVPGSEPSETYVAYSVRVQARIGADSRSAKTHTFIEANTTFEVVEQRQVAGGRTDGGDQVYLRLAYGKGWVFQHHPTNGRLLSYPQNSTEAGGWTTLTADIAQTQAGGQQAQATAGGHAGVGVVAMPVAAQEMMQVQVPPNAPPGSVMQVTTPSGQLVQVTIPVNTVAGSIIQVPIPAAASALASAPAPAPSSAPAAPPQVNTSDGAMTSGTEDGGWTSIQTAMPLAIDTKTSTTSGPVDEV
jgi:hypothetical protein